MTAAGHRTAGPPGQEAALVERRRLLGVTVEVTAPADPFAALLGPLLAGYAPAGPGPGADVRVGIAPGGRPGSWRVGVGEEAGVGVSGADLAARRAEWLLITRVLARLEGFVHVHAAVVATPARSALIVGRSGMGKSTTSVALGRAGLTVYTDDVALIERETLRPALVPRPIKLDERSRALLLDLGLAVPSAARVGESVARPVLPGLPAGDGLGPPLTTAVFLAPRGERPDLRPLTAAETLIRLVEQSSTERLGVDAVSAGALRLAAAVRGYELAAGPLEATAARLVELLGEES